VGSKEQTDGVRRMTDTLRAIDQITQQNVDLASTTANASQLLSSEVQNLQDLMAKHHKTEK
jgi:methyl-accepting chemotaxis protein